MAGFAALLELALVRISVAVGTELELDARVPGLAVGAGGVALGAGHGDMFAGQRVAGLAVIECLLVELGRLPGGGVVALEAVLAKAALVMVFVAAAAGGGEAHPCVIQILRLEEGSFGSGYVLGGVAGAALSRGVLSI